MWISLNFDYIKKRQVLNDLGISWTSKFQNGPSLYNYSSYISSMSMMSLLVTYDIWGGEGELKESCSNDRPTLTSKFVTVLYIATLVEFRIVCNQWKFQMNCISH